jgi:hypothetical protein
MKGAQLFMVQSVSTDLMNGHPASQSSISMVRIILFFPGHERQDSVNFHYSGRGKKLSRGRGKVHEDWLSILAWRFSYAILSMARQKTVSQDTYRRERNLRF